MRTFTEAENYEADRKRRALEEGGARGDRAHARHRGRADEDDPAILAQVPLSNLHHVTQSPLSAYVPPCAPVGGCSSSEVLRQRSISGFAGRLSGVGTALVQRPTRPLLRG